jgi:hypothetical protein
MIKYFTITWSALTQRMTSIRTVAHNYSLFTVLSPSTFSVVLISVNGRMYWSEYWNAKDFMTYTKELKR